jgi:hypothetical protein
VAKFGNDDANFVLVAEPMLLPPAGRIALSMIMFQFLLLEQLRSHWRSAAGARYFQRL